MRCFEVRPLHYVLTCVPSSEDCHPDKLSQSSIETTLSVLIQSYAHSCSALDGLDQHPGEVLWLGSLQAAQCAA